MRLPILACPTMLLPACPSMRKLALQPCLKQ